jgi:hypothetical protein
MGAQTAEHASIVGNHAGGVREFDVDLPRPRSLEIRDEPEFVEYSRAIRDMFEKVGVFKALTMPTPLGHGESTH